MDNLEQKHLNELYEHEYKEIPNSDVYKVNYEQLAVKLAEITADVAIKFSVWCNKPSLEDLRQPNTVYIPSGNFYWYKHKKYKAEELFQEFITNHYGK